MDCAPSRSGSICPRCAWCLTIAPFRRETQAELRVAVDGSTLLQEQVILAGGGGRMERTVELPGAILWSPADPQLHEVELTLAEDDVCLRVGLRQVRIAGRQILIK